VEINSGNRRHLDYLISTIAPECAYIDFVLYGWDDVVERNTEKLKSKFRSFSSYPQPRQRQKTFSEIWGIDDWVSDAFLEFLKSDIQGKSYDIVIVEYVWMSRVFELFGPSVLKIVDTHDVFSGRAELLEKQGIRKEWYYTSVDQERIGLARADIILAITKSDANFFDEVLKHSTSNAQVITIGSCFPAMSARSAFKPVGKSISFGYVASSNVLNKVSINTLLNRLSQKISNSSHDFHINVGGNVSRHIDDYSNLKVFKKGFIEDLSHFYEDSDFILAPMIEGTGLKIKTIEALSNQKAVFATRFASNDLPVESATLQFPSINLMADYIASWLTLPEHELNRTKYVNEYIAEEAFVKLLKTQESRQKKFLDTVGEWLTRISAKSYDVYKPKNPALWLNKKCAVSVIVPTYNTADYLEKCFDSILSDELGDIELLVINDGSNDRTQEICEQYLRKEPRFRYTSQKNSGQAVARNVGISAASGKYLYFVDSDDRVGHNSLQSMFEMSEKDRLDICSPNRDYLRKRPLSYISALPGWCCFLRKDILEEGKTPIRQPKIRSGQDGVFANMALTRCKRSGVCEDADYIYNSTRPDSTFNLAQKNTAAIPGLVEQHLSALDYFYTVEGILESQAIRLALFLQDETYNWRLKKNAKKLKNQEAIQIILSIKGMMKKIYRNLSSDDMKYLDEAFVEIVDLPAEGFWDKIH